MARRAALFNIRPRSGYAHFDSRINGHRIRQALVGDDGQGIEYDERPSREQARAAQQAAEKLYAELVSGRVRKVTARILTGHRLDELQAMWLEDIETPATVKSVATREVYCRHWRAFATDLARWKGDTRTPLERLTADGAPTSYGLCRLGQVTRSTVRKELTSLFQFFDWLQENGHITSVPPRTPLPKGNPGKRAGRQRAKPVDISPEQAAAIISALPEWSDAFRSKRKGYTERAFRVRDLFAFMWEMTWRPSTLARLSVPRNWTPGRGTVTLEDADDKARFGREVTLTPTAKAILERIAPKSGLIFGDHDYRKYIKAAASKVLPPNEAKAFARYDFRHGRINHLLEVTGNMLGTAYMAGHLQLTTTNDYLRAQKRQGDAIVAALATAGAA